MSIDFGVARDPTRSVHKKLVRALPERNSEWVHLHYLPDKWNPSRGAAVVVSDDAGQAIGAVHDRSLVRVSVHHPSFDGARKLARNIHTFLLSPIGGLGLGIDKGLSTNVVVAPDSLAGGFVATASYSVGLSKLFI